MAQTSAPDAKIGTKITLTQVIEGLRHLGIDVLSPIDELKSEESATAEVAALGPTEAGPLDTAESRIPTVPVGARSPWSFPAAPAGAATPAMTTPSAPADLIEDPLRSFVVVDDDKEDTAGASIADGATPGTGDGATPSAPVSGAGGTPVGGGFLCVSCGIYNVAKNPTKSYYAITAGRAVGVFNDWHRVQPLVTGVAHAGFKKYSSKEAATEAFEDARAAGLVVILN